MNVPKLKLAAFLILIFPMTIYAQQRLSLEVNSIDNDRFLFEGRNENASGLSAAGMLLISGVAANEAEGSLTTFAKSYNGLPGYAGYFDIHNANTGLIFRATDSAGNLRFLTGGAAISTNTRMFINASGNVGIGTDLPKAKLEISNGNLLISDNAGQIILKSPDGFCWSVSVDNTGNINTTNITCP